MILHAVASVHLRPVPRPPANLAWLPQHETPAPRQYPLIRHLAARLREGRDRVVHWILAGAQTWTPPGPPPRTTQWPRGLSRDRTQMVAGWESSQAVRTGWLLAQFTEHELPDVALALGSCSPSLARWLVCQHPETLPALCRNPRVTRAARTAAFAALLASDARSLARDVHGWTDPPRTLTYGYTLLPLLEAEALCPGHFPWTAAGTRAVTEACFPPSGAVVDLDLAEALARCATTPESLLQMVGRWAVAHQSHSPLLGASLGALLHNLLVHPKTQAGRAALRALMLERLPSHLLAPHVFPLLPECDQLAMAAGLVAQHGPWASVGFLAGATSVRTTLRPADLTPALTGPIPEARLAAIQLLASLADVPDVPSNRPADPPSVAAHGEVIPPCLPMVAPTAPRRPIRHP